MWKYFALCAPIVSLVACIEEPASPPSLCRTADMPAALFRIAGHDMTDHLTWIQVQPSFTGAGTELQLSFDAEGSQWLSQKTSEMLGQEMDVMVDDVVATSPRVNETITSGRLLITGSQTREELMEMALKIAPPCPAGTE